MASSRLWSVLLHMIVKSQRILYELFIQRVNDSLKLLFKVQFEVSSRGFKIIIEKTFCINFSHVITRKKLEKSENTKYELY